MKYTFSLRRNVFMYNHVLTITDGSSYWEAIIESYPGKDRTLLIWLQDFGFPESETEAIKAEMTQWFAQQNETCLFYAGKGR